MRAIDRNKGMILLERNSLYAGNSEEEVEASLRRRKASSYGTGSSVDDEHFDSSKIRLSNSLELKAGRLYVKEH